MHPDQDDYTVDVDRAKKAQDDVRFWRALYRDCDVDRRGWRERAERAEARLAEAEDLLRQYAWEQVGYAKRLRPVDVEDFLDREEADDDA